MRKTMSLYRQVFGLRTKLKPVWRDWYLKELSVYLSSDYKDNPFRKYGVSIPAFEGETIRGDLLRVGIDADVKIVAIPSGKSGCVLYYELTFCHQNNIYNLPVGKLLLQSNANALVAQSVEDFIVDTNNELLSLPKQKGISEGSVVVYNPLSRGDTGGSELMEDISVAQVCCLGVLGAGGELILWEDIVGVCA